MPEGTLQILGLGTSAVPLDYNVSGNQPLDLIAVKADFDGSAAGSSWVPVVEILSSANELMAQSIGSTVAAGDSVTVTFAPFLRGSSTGSTTGGIQFDTRPQDGGFLYTKTSTDTGDGWGTQLEDDNNGILVHATFDVHIEGDHAAIINSSAGGASLTGATDAGVQATAGALNLLGGASASLSTPGVLICNGSTAAQYSSGGICEVAGPTAVFVNTGGDVIVQLAGVASTMFVTDTGGNEIFRIDQDGSLHGKTGKSLVFDL